MYLSAIYNRNKNKQHTYNTQLLINDVGNVTA